jgi:hypothetical protein
MTLDEHSLSNLASYCYPSNLASYWGLKNGEKNGEHRRGGFWSTDGHRLVNGAQLGVGLPLYLVRRAAATFATDEDAGFPCRA